MFLAYQIDKPGNLKKKSGVNHDSVKTDVIIPPPPKKKK